MALPVIANNNPAAGSISWTAFAITYAGVSYPVPASNTAFKFVWWQYNNGAPSIQGADTLPELGEHDLLLFLNKGGIGMLVPTMDLVDGSLLVAGSVFADAIAANQINSTHILADSIGADELAAGSVYAEHVTAGAITTDKLGVGSVSDSLVTNGSFEEVINGMPTGWTGYVTGGTGSVDVVTGVASSGKNAARLVMGSTATTSTLSQTSDRYIPVTSAGGRTWYIGAVVGAGTATTRGLFVRATWFDANKGQLTYQDVKTNVAVGTTFVLYDGQVTPPAEARYMRVDVIGYQPDVITNFYVDEVVAREIVISAQIGDGQITTPKLVAGAVSADKLESQLVLSSEIIAGDPLSTHAKMTPDGFRVYAQGATGQSPYETVRMGVASSGDLFAITNELNEPVINMDSTGVVAAKSLEASDSLFYKGEELAKYIDSRPRGMAAWGQVPINTNMSSNGEVGLFEIGWDTSQDNPSRMYEFRLNNFLINQTAAGIVGIRLRYTTDGSAPTINSTIIGYNYQYSGSSGLVSTGHMSRIIGSNNGPYIRVLVTLYDATSGIAEVYNGAGQTHLYCTVMDLGESMLGTATATTGGGTPYVGSTVAAPTNPVVTRTVEYGYTSVRSYLPSGAQYNYNTTKAYQGLSPAGYGNLQSQYAFNQNFSSLLSGATINGIWVYLYFEHWYNGSGGTALIRMHGNLTVPATNTGMTSNGMNSAAWPRAAGRWVAVPSALWDEFKSGAFKGFGLIGDGTYNTYGIANNARIRIKYTK